MGDKYPPDQSSLQTYSTHIPGLHDDGIVETKAGAPSPFRATKHEAVLDKGPDVDTSGKRVIFTVEPDDHTDVPAIVYIARELWEDMGSPETVTITVQPGDLLNEPGMKRGHEVPWEPAKRPPDPPYVPGNKVG